MKDYIEREKVLNDLLDQCKITGYGGLTANDVKYVFSLQDNADVREVVRGEWIINSDGYYPYCSNCKSEPPGREMTDFCPNCGAEMRGEKDE